MSAGRGGSGNTRFALPSATVAWSIATWQPRRRQRRRASRRGDASAAPVPPHPASSHGGALLLRAARHACPTKHTPGPSMRGRQCHLHNKTEQTCGHQSGNTNRERAPRVPRVPCTGSSQLLRLARSGTVKWHERHTRLGAFITDAWSQDDEQPCPIPAPLEAHTQASVSSVPWIHPRRHLSPPPVPPPVSSSAAVVHRTPPVPSTGAKSSRSHRVPPPRHTHAVVSSTIAQANLPRHMSAGARPCAFTRAQRAPASALDASTRGDRPMASGQGTTTSGGHFSTSGGTGVACTMLRDKAHSPAFDVASHQ